MHNVTPGTISVTLITQLKKIVLITEINFKYSIILFTGITTNRDASEKSCLEIGHTNEK